MARTPDPQLMHLTGGQSRYEGWNLYIHGRTHFYIGQVGNDWAVTDARDKVLYTARRKRDCLLWLDGHVAPAASNRSRRSAQSSRPARKEAVQAKPSRSTAPTPVDAIKHSDKRRNIPTADAREFVSERIEQVRQVRYTRDESLDPQLVWKGKYDGETQTGDDLVTDAPPIYIQEKIDPRVLIEDLRRTADQPGDEPELTLFDTFDGLEGLDAVDFYAHDANWSNRMILGDSMQVMASLAERERLRGQVQMIYIDPPYGIKFGSNWQVSTDNRDVKDGRLEDAAREAEQIKAFRDTWELGIHSYLSYLRDRLLVARELLTESGSCFVQIGDENVHLVRGLLDEVFGRENFVSQIAFTKTGGMAADVLGGVYDLILWYAKAKDDVKSRRLFYARTPGGPGATGYTLIEEPDGKWRSMSKAERAQPSSVPAGARIFDGTPLVSGGATQEGSQPYTFNGTVYQCPANRHWSTTSAGMDRLAAASRIIEIGNRIEYKRYFEDFALQPYDNLWLGMGQRGFTGQLVYVVQTDPRVIERCLLMCTDPGDLVLDPTCGSGTTAFVAEQWGRRWITVDTSRVALALARQRVMGARYPWYRLTETGDVKHGFEYEKVRHITLKSIANNPDITEGMSGDQIDAAIRRHADYEVLYDKPAEDKKKVRVAGPFTVESLSPHRSLAFAGGPDAAQRESVGEAEGAADALGPNFEQTILDNLAKAGVQNGARQERITFASSETFAGQYIQAIGERRSADGDEKGAPTRVGIAIGPQYGTVSASFVKNAAREALRDSEAAGIDLLCVLGFAFDADVTGVTQDDGVTVEASDQGFANVAASRTLGRIPVLMVRMNVDLLMGEELKKTGAGNLFTVFGEPDIDVDETEDGIVVNLHGVDVYDPTTGEVRSNDTGLIALWMIDTDYNEESFFVRHCYFTGDNDPYKRLKTALKADIDADAWESLRSTVSRPFPRPESGKIAVKVINDYGDEVMKVFEV